ncbi:MAG: Hpt domain-containing protein [Gammaproteobacteria bacterium]|nr:Hpt domain-containing protein [Gammaproteobacteria bacterium]MBT8093502.1 Hpt domain-containing protein [Gammaproteobacteria bacterium]
MMGETDIHEQVTGSDAALGAASGLAIVAGELMETIREAQVALEDCVDGQGGTAALKRAAELLHVASGALRMTETYGAALLVEEMELCCKFVANLRSDKGREDGLDALTRSMVQLPVYIERLLGGGRDIALVLLPMLNDLRAARGEPLLSEGTLLLLNLSPSRSKDRRGEREGSGEDPVVVSQRLRPKFQLALLGWIKGGENQRHLETLSKVAASLEHSATRDDMYQLWMVVGGVLESLQNGGLETSVSLKRLLGQADRQIKYVIDEGLLAYERHPVDDLLNNLLYYVARSSTAGERISRIRAAFNLEELMPGDEQVEHAREALSAPSARLMETVGAAIREDLGRVKDVLDIFVRTGMNKSSELVPQVELLKKISDTLGVLGLGELRGDIDGEIRRLKGIVEQGGIANEGVVMDIASTLLRVEDRLEQQLLRLTQVTEHETPGGEVSGEDGEDFQKVTESVMRECIINLARIKETISQSVGAGAPSAGLDGVPTLISGIKAGLLMLGKGRAMEVVERIGNLVSAMLNAGGTSSLTQVETDRLADAIVSVEYYMETVKAGRSEPWYMLDNAEACLAVLGDVEGRLEMVEHVAPEVEAPGPEPSPASTQRLDYVDVEAMGHVATEKTADVQPQATQVIPLPVVSQQAEHMDPELLELFIEEAKEEIASMKRKLPAWTSEPDDFEALITVRRSFHTLKGSGRMVGAERIGEYCWAVENLLNRLINRTLQRTPPMVDFIVDAAAAVPELVEQLEVGTEPKADINLLMARANAFAEGDPSAAVLQVRRPADEALPEEEPALEMDPVLYDIFSKETAGHLKVITDYLSACEGHTPPFDVTDKLYRACHTLHGSANMANVERGVAVAAALNRFVRHVYDHRVGFEKSGLDALRAAARAIHAIVRDINNPDRERADYTALINHFANLTDAIEAEHAAAPISEAAAPAPAATPRPVPEPAVDIVAEEPGYDAEIAAIFTEESAELLEAADQALIEWTRERATHPMEELKRHLHTLKGGARMAGIAAMGDLSHEIETLLISVDDGRVKPTPAVEDLMQRSIDELHRMRDLVIAGKPVRSVPELEQRIQQANAGFEVADEIELDAVPGDDRVEEAPSAEFTREPDGSVSMIIVDSPLAGELAELAGEQDLGGPSGPNELAAQVPSEYQVPSGHEAAPTPEAEPELSPEPAPPAEVAPPTEPPPPPPGFFAPQPPSAGEAHPEAPPEAVLDEPAAPHEPAELRPLRSAEQRQEFARVDADLLEDLLNAAGEISIYHSRLNQQVNSFDFHVVELESTVARLREQLRKLELETEAQIMHGHQDTMIATREFDPLELDRYSNIQQLSRALAESASDLASLKDLLKSVTNESEGLLVQQARVTAELQDGLMRTRMIPFERYVPRLTRLVRQAAQEAGRRAELAVEGASGELDRQVLEKMLPPLEHMLRNAVVHGIESPYERQAAGKPAVGRITIRLQREGAEMVIDIADDGSGLDVDAIRRKAYETELLQPGGKATDEEIMQFILAPGFSTATTVTQTAGRGVGMDVVANEVTKLGGSLRISSVTGQGTNFTVRLPFTLAITQALIVRTGAEVYALPLPTVEGVARLPRAELESLLSHTEPSYQYGEQTYKFRHLGMYLDGQAAKLPEDDSSVPVILVQAGEFSAALLVDELLASREIVVKALGPQLASIRGISGATILGDGSIVLILDANALVRTGAPVVEMRKAAPVPTDDRPLALVVDDSITVRRVTERFLTRSGLRVETAKDGLDAIGVMQEHKPDVILLDIEMPNMDGYEFASHVRNDPRVADVPIIMITSRVGDKHRARAIELGVNDYLGKPYQDSQLLEAIRRQLEEQGIELH